jgi:autotransporter adhesin
MVQKNLLSSVSFSRSCGTVFHRIDSQLPEFAQPKNFAGAGRRRRTGTAVPTPIAGRIVRTGLAALLVNAGVSLTFTDRADAALVSACTGVSLPPSVVTGVLSPVFGLLNPLLGLGLGSTLTSINSGTPISLQVLDTNGNVVSNTAPCNTTATTFQLDTPAGISFGGNQITGLGNGPTATAGDINAIAIGNGAVTTNSAVKAVALGYMSSSLGANGVALGANAAALNANDVALGSGSTTAAAVGTAGSTIAGTAYTYAGVTPTSTVSVGSVGNERTVTNVAAGRLSATSTDAVNGSQLFATDTAVNSLSSIVNNIFNGGGIKYFHSNSSLPDSTAGGTNSVAIGPAATTSVAATNAVAIGNGSSANATGSIALGAGATTSTANDVALGTNSSAGAADGGWAGMTIGGVTIASNTLNANAVVGISGGGINRQIQGVADGAVNATSTDAVNGSQLFYTIQALNTAVTVPVAADNVNNLAGPTVTAGRNGVAIGYGATSTGLNSVALGNGSTDGGRSNVVSFGSSGAARQLINVAAGTQATDAVNVGQLQPLVMALGGGATFNITTGAVTGPTYNVGGINYNDVGSAINATNRLAVQYTPDANGNPTNHITLSGANNGQAVTISNVANGVNNNDAVNVGQLKAAMGNYDQIINNLSSLQGQVNQNQDEARRGIATSAAMANLPFSATPGKWSPAVGYGSFKGQTAVAMGIQYTSDNYIRLKVRATASFVPGTSDVTFGGGAGWEF